MKLLSLDPGLVSLGYLLATIENQSLTILKGDTLKAPPNLPLSKRLYFIFQNLKELLERERPDWVILEELIPQANPHSTYKIFQVQAIALVLAEEMALPFKIYHPSYWKSFLCGDGKATKKEVQRVLRNLLGKEIEPFLKKSDVADALALTVVAALELKLL